MKVNAIIAEYNPYHKGHVFQMENAKNATGADCTIVLMSGNFVQRGIPAVMDKQTRAKMALEAGADLILELPFFYSCASAEFFASGAISLLDRLGVVDHVCFGSECGDLEAISRVADILLEESDDFKKALRYELESGKSYPLARTQAILSVDPSLLSQRDLFQAPNNILALEYVKALKHQKSTMQAFTTRRHGNGYSNPSLGGDFVSALAIREALLAGNTADNLASQVPDCNQNTFVSYFNTYKPVFANDFSDLLYMKLQENCSAGFDKFFDVSNDLSNRIQNEMNHFESFNQFADLLKTKEITYSRISRSLMHILLDVTKMDMQLVHPEGVRVLGFSQTGKELLKAISDHDQIKLISKLANAKDILPEGYLRFFEKEMAADSLYEYVKAKKASVSPISEYSKSLCII